MVNFLQNFSHFLSNTPSHLLQPQPYCISCKNTWGQPSEAHTFHKDITGLPSQVGSKLTDMHPTVIELPKTVMMKFFSSMMYVVHK